MKNVKAQLQNVAMANPPFAYNVTHLAQKVSKSIGVITLDDLDIDKVGKRVFTQRITRAIKHSSRLQYKLGPRKGASVKMSKKRLLDNMLISNVKTDPNSSVDDNNLAEVKLYLLDLVKQNKFDLAFATAIGNEKVFIAPFKNASEGVLETAIKELKTKIEPGV